jgi:serine/threonine-protein kinase ATR
MTYFPWVRLDLLDGSDIRTYGVVTLNEECGFIQWVPNTIPIRPVLMRYYEARRIKSWVSTDFCSSQNIMCARADGGNKTPEMSEVFRKIKEAADKEAAELFVTKILPTYVVFRFFFLGDEN